MKITELQDESPVVRPFRQAIVLASVGVVLWALLAGPAWFTAGKDGLIGLSVSAALCVAPGVLILLLVGQFKSPQSMLPLLGSVIRLMIVFSGCLAVVELMPSWGFREFFIWLITYYFILLAVETLFVLQGLKSKTVPGSPDTSVSA